MARTKKLSGGTSDWTPACLIFLASTAAAALRGLHLSATPYGGGVAELLRSLVPLMNDLGLKTEWQIISGDERFFRATKAIHNGLQGSAVGITVEEEAAYEITSRENAARLETESDIVFVHDPQPVALLSMYGRNKACWIWRCHIDTSDPNPQVWEMMRELRRFARRSIR